MTGWGEREARAWLLRAAEPVDRVLAGLVERVGAQAAVELIRDSGPCDGIDVEGLRGRAGPDAGRRDLEAAAEVGARLVIPGDDEWPGALDDLGRVGLGCLGLYVRGEGLLTARTDRAVAIVGTRAGTDYGTWVAAELAHGLAGRGWCVVSGLAFGIDAAAHGGALAAGPMGAGTVAVTACGVDAVYPRAHAGLQARLLSGGLVVTEHPPGSAPHRGRFLVRNRIIAVLSAGTVVVEAAARSGARSTARYAAALGRAVMAVPGPVNVTTSVGCHQLLRDDPATVLITGVDDVIEAVGAIGELAPRPQGPVMPRDALDPLSRRVLDALPVRRPRPAESVAVTAGIAVERTTRLLDVLLAAGYADHEPDGWRLSTRERDARRLDRQQEALDLGW